MEASVSLVLVGFSARAERRKFIMMRSFNSFALVIFLLLGTLSQSKPANSQGIGNFLRPLLEQTDITWPITYKYHNRNFLCAEKYAEKARKSEKEYYKFAAQTRAASAKRREKLFKKMSRSEKKYVKYRVKSDKCFNKARRDLKHDNRNIAKKYKKF